MHSVRPLHIHVIMQCRPPPVEDQPWMTHPSGPTGAVLAVAEEYNSRASAIMHAVCFFLVVVKHFCYSATASYRHFNPSSMQDVCHMNLV